jgi:hypothetical protein
MNYQQTFHVYFRFPDPDSKAPQDFYLVRELEGIAIDGKNS